LSEGPALDPNLPDDPEAVLAHILDPELRGNALYPLYHQLRTLAPVFKTTNPQFQQAWVITRFADDDGVARSKALISDQRVLEIFDTGDGGAFIQVMKRLLKFLDPPEHARVRNLISGAFTPRSVERLRPRIQQIVDELIDAHYADGSMDVVADFATPLPLRVICELLGVPVADTDLFFQWSRDFARRGDVGALTAERERRADAAATGLDDYFRQLVAERTRSPREDLISELIRFESADGQLGAKEIAATGIILLQAGHETTANLIGAATLALLHHPDELARLRARPELIESATEEFVRFDTPVQITPKIAAEDLPYHDRLIREGDAVATLRGAVNRDPAQYHEPDRLDLTREDSRHHSFGVGPYHCLGASLARAEIQIAMGTLVARLSELSLETARPRWKPNLYLHGLEALNVAWKP
jgi:cytochrome P450